MAKLYTKNIWVDEILAGLETYNVSGVGAGQTVVMDQTVTQAGSPVNAARMNNLENGVDAIDTRVDEQSSGWVSGSGTWSYVSADDPVFVMNVPDAQAVSIGVGDRIKLTQTTAKYFIVVAKGAPSGGNTPVTIYGGTDYVLANVAITLPYWSHVKSPLGFPMQPSKWTVSALDVTIRSQATPVAGTWYNLGGVAINLPIGAWKGGYDVGAQLNDTTSGVYGFATTLSTGSATESDSSWTNKVQFYVVTATGFASVKRGYIEVTVKTPLYLNTSTSSANVDTIYNRNDQAAAVIKFVSAYL